MDDILEKGLFNAGVPIEIIEKKLKLPLTLKQIKLPLFLLSLVYQGELL